MAKGMNRGKEAMRLIRAKVEELKGKRAERTPAQQIEELDKRLGKGVGAKKERARLACLASNTRS